MFIFLSELFEEFRKFIDSNNRLTLKGMHFVLAQYLIIRMDFFK
jgi:hypothetical protein